MLELSGRGQCEDQGVGALWMGQSEEDQGVWSSLDGSQEDQGPSPHPGVAPGLAQPSTWILL